MAFRHEALIYRHADGTYSVPEVAGSSVIKTEGPFATRAEALNVALYMERVYGATWDRLAHSDDYCACDYCSGVIN